MFKSYTQRHFVDEKATVNASYYVTKLLPNLIKDCRHCRISCRTTSSFSKMAHLLTQQPCPRLDQKEMPWFRWKKRMATEFARSQSIGLSRVGRDAGTLSEIHAKTDQHCRAEHCLYRYEMICYRSSLIRQSCHFERDFDRALLQLVDILNTQFKYREDS